ncbi:hypothetical protein HK105_204585 [Polyrhizophydium stewartii]|uniref:Copper transport protein n=1 Tax=Polyrhizophydium stewartii TaxID=2732419 RepID=A0ABR4N8W0_9FUNG|nr:hypothetical protein HK105_003763 [Polyrhizophydium stewartii]
MLARLVLAAIAAAAHAAAQTGGLADPAAAAASLSQLCAASSTQHLAACSLKTSCKTTTTGACADATLLATACETDAAVAASSSACAPVTAACPSGASSSALCAPVPALPSTLELQQRIFVICKVMNMDGCNKCAAPATNTTVASCDVMAVYSQLCHAMPDMSSCTPYNTMCAQSPLPNALAPFCPSAAGSTDSTLPSAFDETAPLMQMFLHTGINDYVLFKSFVPRNNGQYFGALVFSFALAVLYHAISAFRKWRLAAFAAQARALAASGNKNRKWSPRTEIQQLEKAVTRAVEVFVSYMLMLIVMAFNVGLIFAVIVGVLVGSYIFDRSPIQDDDNLCC